MRAVPKEEQHSIDLVEKNYVYGDTKQEGKLVFFFFTYIYLGLTELLKWSFKHRDHDADTTTQRSDTTKLS